MYVVLFVVVYVFRQCRCCSLCVGNCMFMCMCMCLQSVCTCAFAFAIIVFACGCVCVMCVCCWGVMRVAYAYDYVSGV